MREYPKPASFFMPYNKVEGGVIMQNWRDVLKTLLIIIIMLGIPISLIIFDWFQMIGFASGII